VTATTISARINAERLMLLCWGRAILLQIAHPLVAAGVADHSSFREGKVTAVVRLHETVRAMLSLTFGSDSARNETLSRINGIHRRVNGTLRERAGPFDAGTVYSAEDPALLLWVHGTLLESAFLVYERLFTPLSEVERDAYCVEAVPVVRGLGVTEGEPRSWTDLNGYMARMYASGHITVSRPARELASSLLAPPLAWAVAPAIRVNRLFTIGLLPPLIRDQYGFAWTTRDRLVDAVPSQRQALASRPPRPLARSSRSSVVTPAARSVSDRRGFCRSLDELAFPRRFRARGRECNRERLGEGLQEPANRHLEHQRHRKQHTKNEDNERCVERHQQLREVHQDTEAHVTDGVGDRRADADRREQHHDPGELEHRFDEALRKVKHRPALSSPGAWRAPPRRGR
jgi:uncharacterized protein (DUF2236 family)